MRFAGSESPHDEGDPGNKQDAETGGEPGKHFISAPDDQLPRTGDKRHKSEKDDEADDRENDHQLFLGAGKAAVARLGAFADNAHHPVSDETHQANQEDAAECLKQPRDARFGGRAQASMTLRAIYRRGLRVVPALEAVTLFGRPGCLFHISEKYNTGKPEKVGYMQNIRFCT